MIFHDDYNNNCNGNCSINNDNSGNDNLVTIIVLVVVMPEVVVAEEAPISMVVVMQQRPWSTMECSQPASCIPCFGLPWKTDQLQHEPSQSYVLGRRCDPVSSTFTSHSGSALASPDMRSSPWLCPACLPFTTSMSAPPNHHCHN